MNDQLLARYKFRQRIVLNVGQHLKLRQSRVMTNFEAEDNDQQQPHTQKKIYTPTPTSLPFLGQTECRAGFAVQPSIKDMTPGQFTKRVGIP
jgi:hypothetical protein